MRRLFHFASFLDEKIAAQSAKNTDPSMTDNQRGATFMMLSMAAFVLNDTFVKLLGGHIPLFEILFSARDRGDDRIGDHVLVSSVAEIST